MITVQQHEKLIFRVTGSFINKLPANVSYVSDSTTYTVNQGASRSYTINTKAHSNKKEVFIFSSIVTDNVVYYEAHNYKITNNDTEAHIVELVFVSSAGVESYILDPINLESGHCLLYDGDTVTLYNANGDIVSVSPYSVSPYPDLVWIDYTVGWKEEPTLNTTITGGEVWNYIYATGGDDLAYYRYIATDGSIDAFYTTFANPTLSGLIVEKKIIL